jgi:hypothetical protein
MLVVVTVVAVRTRTWNPLRERTVRCVLQQRRAPNFPDTRIDHSVDDRLLHRVSGNDVRVCEPFFSVVCL